MLRAVARDDVPDLMTQYTDELRLIIGCVNQPAMDVDEPTRQRECIDLGRVDNFELIRDLATLRALGQPLTQL